MCIRDSYNTEHGINPETIRKSLEEILHSTAIADIKAKRDEREKRKETKLVAEPVLKFMTKEQKQELIEQLRTEMREAAKDLEFERAAQLRDEIARLQEKI